MHSRCHAFLSCVISGTAARWYSGSCLADFPASRERFVFVSRAFVFSRDTASGRPASASRWPSIVTPKLAKTVPNIAFCHSIASRSRLVCCSLSSPSSSRCGPLFGKRKKSWRTAPHRVCPPTFEFPPPRFVHIWHKRRPGSISARPDRAIPSRAELTERQAS